MTTGALARWLLAAALVLAFAGIVLILLERAGFGRVPGNLVWRGDRVTIYLPIGLMILLSILLTVLLNIVFRR